jgi:hypothetical protein
MESPSFQIQHLGTTNTVQYCFTLKGCNCVNLYRVFKTLHLVNSICLEMYTIRITVSIWIHITIFYQSTIPIFYHLQIYPVRLILSTLLTSVWNFSNYKCILPSLLQGNFGAHAIRPHTVLETSRTPS